MKWIFLKKLKDEKGQNLVEFAIMLIVLLIVFAGIVEFGRAWYRLDKLKGAANIAARTYAITKDAPNARTAADGVEVGMGAKAVFNPSTTVVKVTVSEPFRSLYADFVPILKNITTLRRDATYRLEQ